MIPDWLDREAFPFTPKQVGALSVTDVGQGPAVLFAHGTPTWSFEWRHALKALQATHRCIAPDHLGFGLSPRPTDGDYRPEAHARRWGELLETLKLDRYSLVAHDFGGPIALDAALNHPERLERVVLFNTIAWPFTDDPSMARQARLAGSGLFRWLDRQLNFSFVISRSAWGRGPRSRAMWRQYTQVFPDAESRERVLFALARSLAGSTPFFRSLWDRRERLAKTPIHFVWGLRDNAFRPSVLQRFREAWPHATVTPFENAGHWPHEEEPERCVEELARRLAPPGS
jgi:haloalkane dehalogenase